MAHSIHLSTPLAPAYVCAATAQPCRQPNGPPQTLGLTSRWSRTTPYAPTLTAYGPVQRRTPPSRRIDTLWALIILSKANAQRKLSTDRSPAHS